MIDMLVVATLKQEKFGQFMSFMQSDAGITERKKVADLSKTIGTVSPDQSKVMFKIAVHDVAALRAFLDGSNPVSKPVFDEVMEGFEIYDLQKA